MRARFCNPLCKGIITIGELIFKALVELCCFAMWNYALESSQSVSGFLQEAGPQEAAGCQETHEGSSHKGEQENGHKNTLEAAQKMMKESLQSLKFDFTDHNFGSTCMYVLDSLRW